MKEHFLISILFLFLAPALYSQAPQSIPYQAVVRNTDGSTMANAAVTITFKIHDNSATGTVVYEETHATTTNAQGLVSLNVGGGTAVTGTFSGIQWGTGSKFLHVLMNAGYGVVDLGTQQMMSVPYALYAENTGQSNNPSSFSYNSVSQRSENSLTFMEALNYCASLNESGYSDWRMPSLDEVLNYISVEGITSTNMSTWTRTPTNTKFQMTNSMEFYIVIIDNVNSYIDSKVTLIQNFSYNYSGYDVHFPVFCIR